MDNAAYKQFSATAAEMTKTVFEGQIALCDTFAQTAKGTPVAPLFDAAARMQRAALEGFETLSSAAMKEPSKADKKSAAKKAAAPFEATTKAMKKAVDAQADMMVDAGVETVAATSEAKDAVEKAVDHAAKGDMVALYDDLTAVTGIGPATMKKLNAEGIRTVSDLASTSAKELGDILESANVRMLKYTPADWIEDAKSLMKSAAA